MFRNFSLAIFRTLWRSKIHSLINIASLCIGLTIFAFASLYVKREFGHDRSWSDASRIHRLVVEQHGLPNGRDGVTDSVSARMLPKFRSYFPSEIDKITRTANFFVKPADRAASVGYVVSFVDPDFADIFKLDVVQGSLESVLQTPGLLAVEEQNLKYFGEDAKLGTRLSVQGSAPNSGKIDFQIGAIFRNRPGANGIGSTGLIAGIGDYARPLMGQGPVRWETSVRIWVKLKPGVATNNFNAMLPGFIDKEVAADDLGLKAGDRLSEHISYRFQNITDLYFHPINDERGIDMTRVLTFAAVGLLVLLVGCSNSVSLSMASTWERRREVGIRKTNGATRWDVVVQFLGEAVLLALVALVPAVVIVELLLPLFNAQMHIEPRFALTLGFTDSLFLLFIAVAVGLINGAYPSLVLAVTKPGQVLRGENGVIKNGLPSVRMLLVAFQFGFATMLLIATLVLYAQLQVAHRQPLGFDASNTLIVSSMEQADRAAVGPQELRKVSGVTAAVSVFGPPASESFSRFGNIYSKQGEIIEAEALQSYVSYDNLFATFNIPLLAGRVHDQARDHRDRAASDQRYPDQDSQSSLVERVVINRSAARVLGFSSPDDAVGKQIFSKDTDRKGAEHENVMQIIGVVEDSMYRSLKRKPGPEYYQLMDEPSVIGVAIKYEPSYAATIEKSVRESWVRTVGAPPENIQFGETLVASAFLEEEAESRLLLSCAALALFLSAIGLYGLASFTMARRSKEVGVRKVLGARVISITGMFLWQYARPVLLTNVIAWPVAAYFLLQWLQHFPYQLDKLWLLPLCIAASALVLLIAMLSVASVAVRAASNKPVLSLRYE